MRRTVTILVTLCATAAPADPVVIEDVRLTQTGETWRIDVTVSHPDTGWDHYADGWDVLGPDGTSLGTRILHHPHVDEQPFTRSLSGVVIPDGVTEITLRAHCSVDEWAGAQSVRVPLDR